jgi:hypothetical protein
VEDIDNCGTLAAMLERMKNTDRRYNDAQKSEHTMLGGASASACNVDDETSTPLAADSA